MDWVAAVGRHPRAAAVVGALCIAFSGIFFRLSGVSPATATFFRCLYALPVLGLVALGERRRYGPFSPRRHAVALLSGVFFAADLLLWHHAVNDVGAGLATVVANLQVVVVAAVAWFALHERPSRNVGMAIPLMLTGALLISGLIGSGAYGADPRLGVMLGLASAVAYAGYLLLTRQGNPGGLRPGTMLFDASVSTAVVAAVVGTIIGELDPVPAWPAHGWLLLVALTSQVAGYLLISASLPRLPAALTSVILLAQPVATVIAAGILLAEAPSPVQLAGVGLVVVGLLVVGVRTGPRPLSRGAPASDAGPRALA